MGMGVRTITNSALLLAARTLAKLAAFLVIVLQWNSLGSYHYGQFAILAVYVSLTSMVADLGLQSLFVREVARRPSDMMRYLENLLSARLFLMLPAAAILALALAVLAPELVPFALATIALLAATSYATLLRATYYALGLFKWEALTICGEGMILLGGGLLTVRAHAGVAGFLWSYVAAAVFTISLTVVVLRARGTRLRWRLEGRWLWDRLRIGFPFALAFVVSTLYFRVDVVLLQGFTRNDWNVVGWYQGAYKYIDAVVWIPQTAMSAVFPVFAMLYAQSPDRLREAAARSFKVLVAMGLPIGVGMVVVAGALVRFTRGLPPSASSLSVLGFAVIFIFANNAFLFMLSAIDRQMSVAWLATWSLIVNVGLNLVLIPAFSLLAPASECGPCLGASWATVLTEIFLFAGGWWLLRRHLVALPVLTPVAPVLVAGLLEVLALLPLRQAPAWLSIVVAAAVYGTGLFLLRAFTPEERALFRAVALGVRKDLPESRYT